MVEGVAFLVAPASAAPLPLGDHAALTKEASNAPVQTVHYKAKYKRYAVAVRRRCKLAMLPLLTSLQYRCWQFYYLYGGPLLREHAQRSRHGGSLAALRRR